MEAMVLLESANSPLICLMPAMRGLFSILRGALKSRVGGLVQRPIGSWRTDKGNSHTAGATADLSYASMQTQQSYDEACKT